MNAGRLIAFEGLDGCGKTTQVARLVAALRAAGHEVVETREPTDGSTGRRIRAMARSGESVSPEQQLAWFFEDRREHVAGLIAPALEKGQIVVTDRYYPSTVAYQGARGLDPERILTESEAEFPLPDLVLILEIDAEAALQRVTQRGAARDAAFERLDLLERVAAIFGSLERPYLERVDARGDPDAVHAAILARLRERLDLP